MRVELKKKRNVLQITKYAQYVQSMFGNRNKQVQNFHQDSEDEIVIDNQSDEDTQNETIPSMVLAIDTVPSEVS